MSQTNKFSTHLSKLQWIILLAVLIALLIPRFDRADRFGLDQFTTKGNPAIEHLADAKKYIDQIRYFRGEGGVELLKGAMGLSALFQRFWLHQFRWSQ